MFTYFNITSKHAVKREARPQQIKTEFCLDSNDFRFICEGVNSTRDYKNNNKNKQNKNKQTKTKQKHAWYNVIQVVSYKCTAIWAPTKLVH